MGFNLHFSLDIKNSTRYFGKMWCSRHHTSHSKPLSNSSISCVNIYACVKMQRSNTFPDGYDSLSVLPESCSWNSLLENASKDCTYNGLPSVKPLCTKVFSFVCLESPSLSQTNLMQKNFIHFMFHQREVIIYLSKKLTTLKALPCL